MIVLRPAIAVNKAAKAAAGGDGLLSWLRSSLRRRPDCSYSLAAAWLRLSQIVGSSQAVKLDMEVKFDLDVRFQLP